MTWTADERHRKHFGNLSMVPQTNGNRETAHLIDLGHSHIRVLPDETHSGQKRGLVVAGALNTATTALVGVSEAVVDTYILGELHRAGLAWERVVPVPDLVEWLDNWFVIWGHSPGKTLIRDLRRADWLVVRDEDLCRSCRKAAV